MHTHKNNHLYRESETAGVLCMSLSLNDSRSRTQALLTRSDQRSNMLLPKLSSSDQHDDSGKKEGNSTLFLFLSNICIQCMPPLNMELLLFRYQCDYCLRFLESIKSFFKAFYKNALSTAFKNNF